MDTRPIGVFDSGVGGLTAVRELREILPGEELIYFGDTARVPYGTRSAQTIRKYAAQDIRFLASFDVKAIIAACGTVSSNFSSGDVRAMGIEIPYITVVDPAVEEAVAASKNKKIGMIATTASVKSGSYPRAIGQICPDCVVTSQACPLLISLVELGLTSGDHPVTRPALEMYLAPMKEAGVDTIILGCTHFPLLREGIAQLMGPGVTLVDSGAAAARKLERILIKENMLSDRKKAGVSYYVTDTVDSFSAVAKIFLTDDITGTVERVDVEQIEKRHP